MDKKDIRPFDTTHITYGKGYKYQLKRDYWVDLAPDIFGHEFSHQFFSMSMNGLLAIRSGYAWDGPSGPAVDSRNFLRSSLVHDALYQAAKVGALPARLRKRFDDLLYLHCRQDGMSAFRATYVRWAVRAFGQRVMLRPETIHTAPHPRHRRALSS